MLIDFRTQSTQPAPPPTVLQRPRPIVFGSGLPRPLSTAPIPHSTPPTCTSFGQSPQAPPPTAPAPISFGRPHLAPTHSVAEHFPPPAPIFFGQPPHALEVTKSGLLIEVTYSHYGCF